MHPSILLPCSVAEAIDKYTILLIKRDKLTAFPDRLIHVQHELDEITTHIEAAVDMDIRRLKPPQPPLGGVTPAGSGDFPTGRESPLLYYIRILHHINGTIWDIQDEFRADPTSQYATDLMYDVHSYNDARCRVKQKINQYVHSTLREVKGYDETGVIVWTHLGLGDMIHMNGAIRYFSTRYDEVIVPCKLKYINIVQAMYQDDPSIVVIPLYHNPESELPAECMQLNSKYKSFGYDVKASGMFISLFTGTSHVTEPYPAAFYTAMGLPDNIRTLYYYNAAQVPQLPFPAESYAFAALESSTHTMKLDTAAVSQPLLISPSMDTDFFAYMDIIQHASSIHVIDSAYYALVLYTSTQTTEKTVYLRNPNMKYSDVEGWKVCSAGEYLL